MRLRIPFIFAEKPSSMSSLFLTVVQALVTILLVVVILIQKSEGGGLGVGGSQAGFMSARGAADFMTRMTQVLGGLFVVLSIILAALAVKNSSAQTVDDRSTAPCPPPGLGSRRSAGQDGAGRQSSAPAAPSPVDPLAGSAKSKSLSMIAPPPHRRFGGEAALWLMYSSTGSFTRLWIDPRQASSCLSSPTLTIKARFP
jgi:preprotein translocase subunit SecG